jgi:uncharacterized membrane protein YqiK
MILGTAMTMQSALIGLLVISLVVILMGILIFLAKFLVKAEQGQALICTGLGKTTVRFTSVVIIPLFHRLEIMDISVKRVEIERSGKDGLICKDNIRADIKVAFFVRVNKTESDVLNVAQCIGCKRASDLKALVDFFDAKFSEALKTVGKGFDFTELYTSREKFKHEIIQIIGTDLNGYVLDDAAIDYLEQTPIEILNPNNILDADGIKKITDLTATQAILSNKIDRDREKTIRQQDVEAREAILELERQLAQTEEKQKKEVAAVKAREQAEAAKIQHEERQKWEQARIAADEEIRVAEENKDRQIIVARKAKERTEQIETERIERDRLLEVTERERIVSLAQIERDRAVEEERKNIQAVIRERVAIERTVVEEEERIKDTRAHAEATREKTVAITRAAKEAEEKLVMEVKAAEAKRNAANFHAEQIQIDATAEQIAAEKRASAIKIIADAKAEEEAIHGLSEVRVLEARAGAIEKEGAAEAAVIQMKADAEAKGRLAKADAWQREGVVDAENLHKRLSAEAKGIEEKADAMRKLDGVGKEHEEFKIKMNLHRDVQLAQINVQKDIAAAQASVIGEGLKNAKIDIVGGDQVFFDRLVGAIANGKSVDRLIENSAVLTDIKETLFTGDAEKFRAELRRFVDQFGMTSDDIRNLSLSALIVQLMDRAGDGEKKSQLGAILETVKSAGFAGVSAASVLGGK